MTFAVVLFTQFGMGTLHRRVESIVNICFSVNIVLVLLWSILEKSFFVCLLLMMLQLHENALYWKVNGLAFTVSSVGERGKYMAE